MHPSFCTQNRTIPTHHRTPDGQSWCSRLAMDVGDGQTQSRCIDSPVRRRGGIESSENGVVLHGNPPPLHTHGTNWTVLTHQRTVDAPPPVGVPASPWMWAKASSKLGALVRLCGDGVVSNEARIDRVILHENNYSPLMHTHTHRTGPLRPTTALQMARVGVPASPWMWAKARSKLGPLIRLCGDRLVVSNE